MRSQNSGEEWRPRAESRRDSFWVSPEAEGGVGGLAGTKKEGMQIMVAW